LKTSGGAVVRLPPLVVGLAKHSPLHGILDNGSFVTSVTASGAARMKPKKPWSPRNQLAKIFTGALDQLSTVRKTSTTAPPEQISWLRYRLQPLVPP